MKVIILAGGGGTRLFPLSRTCFPKQFMKVGGEQSLLEQTAKRFLPLAKAEDIVIVTNEKYFHHVKSELTGCGLQEAHVILEPVGRNTARPLRWRCNIVRRGCRHSQTRYCWLRRLITL